MMAPPWWHHFDTEMDGSGWRARLKYTQDLEELTAEVLRTAPWDAEIPERLSFEDEHTPDEDTPVELFLSECVDERDRTDVFKEDLRAAYYAYAEEHDLDTDVNKQQIGRTVSRYFELSEDDFGQRTRGDRRPYTYKGITLNSRGKDWLNAAHNDEDDADVMES